MIESFRRNDLSSLVELFNGFAPERYGIDVDLLRQNTIECPTFDWGASCAEEGEAFLAIKTSPNRLYKGPSPDIAFINSLAFKDPKRMLELMREVKLLLRNRGVYRLHFGTDSGHFFPGCPTDFHHLRDFLIIGGFEEGGQAHDMERDLTGYESPAPVPDGDDLRPCTGADLPALREFFEREFPGRWRYDVLNKINKEEDPGCVFGLFNGPVCNGFALLQWEGSKFPIGGAVWKKSLGESWGSLGPIGVSQSIRKRGSGNALLGKALEHLRDKGTKRCIIDWTGLTGFYGGHGFEVTRTYRYMTLNLELD